MINPNPFLPCVQVRHKTMIFFDLWLGDRKGRDAEEVRSMQKTAYSGQITPETEKRIRRAIDLLLQLSPERIIYNPVAQAHHPFTINFITLTVSDRTIRPHKEVYQKCLRSYLKWQIRKGARHYIWKAELQQRGQVHYHITTNQFIHYLEIQKKWNSLQRKAGYLDGFAKEHKHYNANSTDVHSVRNVKDIEAYLVKYICKSPGTGIDGKVWDCSDSLKKPFFYCEMDFLNIPDRRSTNFIEKERFAIWKGVRKLTSDQFNLYQQYISSL